MTTRTAGAELSGTPFTRYQIFVIAVLAFLQFTVVLDFMVLSPLGAVLIQELGVTTEQFGRVVAGYAIAAGVSGLLSAGFADRYDRKRLLLFFYTGFVLGTLLCGLAPNYSVLLAARIVTGLFGGVVGSVTLAIVADLFSLSQRGRVMGVITTSFAASQVLGLPIGLWLAAHYGWHSTFLAIVGVATVAGMVIMTYLRPIDAHLALTRGQQPLRHLYKTALRPRYLAGFAATLLLATGGYMLMPFGSTFSVNNMGIGLTQLPTVYMITGICSLIVGPLMGRLSDRMGKVTLFSIATVAAALVIVYFTRLGLTPLWKAIVLNCILFTCISARMVSAGALTSAMPEITDRGAYMSITSSLQQFAGGGAAWVAGKIVVQLPSGRLDHYPLLGIIVATIMVSCLPLMYNVQRIVTRTPASPGLKPGELRSA